MVFSGEVAEIPGMVMVAAVAIVQINGVKKNRGYIWLS